MQLFFLIVANDIFNLKVCRHKRLRKYKLESNSMSLIIISNEEQRYKDNTCIQTMEIETNYQGRLERRQSL
jgi:hypothetical protein